MPKKVHDRAKQLMAEGVEEDVAWARANKEAHHPKGRHAPHRKGAKTRKANKPRRRRKGR